MDEIKKIYETYKAAFTDIHAISANPHRSCSEPNHWLSCITIDPAKSSVKPAKIMAVLAVKDCDSRSIWKPTPLHPVFVEYNFISVNDDAGRERFERGLFLPSDIKMTDEELESILSGMF